MQLDIQGTAIARRAPVRRHIEQRALFELARLGERVDTVRLRVTEREASAEHRYHCGAAVTVVHDDASSRYVLARAEGDDVFRLIEDVLSRVSSLVGGEIARAEAAREAQAEWMALASGGDRRGS
jgi:hypothetical protein